MGESGSQIYSEEKEADPDNTHCTMLTRWNKSLVLRTSSSYFYTAATARHIGTAANL